MEKREHMFVHESKDHEVHPSTSRNSAEITYASRSFSNGNTSSTVVFDGNSKEGDMFKSSSDCVASKMDIYAKSDISSDTGPSLYMDARTVNASDFCKRIIRDRKPGTESSCSSSTQVARPVASSNDSYQEISTEAKSSEHHTGGSSVSFPTNFRCSIEEPVTSREVSGMGLQIIQKGVCNTGARDYLNLSGTTTNQTSFAIKEENSSMSNFQKQSIADELSQVKKEQSKLAPHSHWEESSESVMTIAEDVATKAYEFDLNEDIHNNNIDFHNQTGPSCSVIHVVAKSGVARRIPVTPLKFEGAQGWKGSAATSAFRRTLSKCSDRTPSNNDHTSEHSKGFFAFDLNVASEEDNALKVASHRAERPSFDLNCLSDTTDECPQALLPETSSKALMVDFNLNEDPSVDINDDIHQQFRSSQHMDNFPESSRDHSLTFARPVYLADLSPIQFFGHTQARPLLMAAPNVLQPVEQMQKLPYMMQTLPSHNYPSGGPFFFATNESLSTGIHYPGSNVPYARDTRTHPVFPQIMNHGTLPSFPGTTPHLMQVVHVQSPNEVTGSNVVNGEPLSVNRNMRDYTRQYLSPGKSSKTADEQVRPFDLAASGANQPMKRREPDGGWNSYQIGNRQFTSWN